MTKIFIFCMCALLFAGCMGLDLDSKFFSHRTEGYVDSADVPDTLYELAKLEKGEQPTYLLKVSYAPNGQGQQKIVAHSIDEPTFKFAKLAIWHHRASTAAVNERDLQRFMSQIQEVNQTLSGYLFHYEKEYPDNEAVAKYAQILHQQMEQDKRVIENTFIIHEKWMRNKDANLVNHMNTVIGAASETIDYDREPVQLKRFPTPAPHAEMEALKEEDGSFATPSAAEEKAAFDLFDSIDE